MTAESFTYCLICGVRPADNHEICSRGSGGPEEDWNQLRLCRVHHTEAHTLGWFAFIQKYPRLAGKVIAARNKRGLRTTSRVERE